MGHYSAAEGKGLLLFGTVWVDLEGAVLNGIHQTEKDKSCKVSLTCKT